MLLIIANFTKCVKQGDTTVVLADAVGEEGCVVAVDPGALDYGEL